MRIRIGFVGAGAWGRVYHLPALAYLRDHRVDGFEVELAALCERQPDVARDVATGFGFSRVFPSVEAMLAAGGLDAVAVVVKPRTLEPIVMQIADSGLALLTEKPPTLTSNGAARLAAHVLVPHVVGFNRRYFPLVEQFKTLVDQLMSPYFAAMTFYRSERYDSPRFAAAPDTYDFPFAVGTAIHGLNLLEYLGGEVTGCEVRPLPVRSNGTHGWLAQLSLRSGLVAEARVLPCSGSSVEWVEVHSQRRSLYLRAGLLFGTSDQPGRIEVHEAGRIVDQIDGDASEPAVVQYGFVGEYLDLFRAIRDHSPTRSTFVSAVSSMRVCEQFELAVPPRP